MFSSIPPTRIYWFAIPVLALLLWMGLRNQTDPLWTETDTLLHTPTLLVGDAVDSLQHLFAEVHHLPKPTRSGDSSALRHIMYDYSPTIEWHKFAETVRQLQKKRFMVISGVTGVGSTSLSIRVARLFARSKAQLMEIKCAPQFDLEYHKKYIGWEHADGKFEQGKLLQFWDRCRQNPNQPFIAVIDNFDKINPETFFGPEIWEILNDRTTSAVVGGRGISIPENFYMISATHLGPGSHVDLNEEHFKRIGRLHIVGPSTRELLARLEQKASDLKAMPYRHAADEKKLAALQDTAQLLPYLFAFQKANSIVQKLYSDGYQLGQSSNVKDYFRKEDYPELKKTFVNHVNAFHPARPLVPDDFDDLDYTIKHHGRQHGTNFFARQIQFLQDTGYLVEITVVASTALLTALIGWWVFRNRELLIRSYGDRVRELFIQFERQEISADQAAFHMEEIKKEVDQLVVRRKLNYTEGLYFLAFIEDKVKRIEFAKNVSENFLDLFDSFMEDNYLSENEYLKIKQFLMSMRHKLPEEVFNQFLQKTEDTYLAGVKTGA